MHIKTINVAIICYLIGITYYSFDPLMQAFPSILTDQLMKTFYLSSIGIGFIASSYFYIYNIMQIPMGILCDKYQIKSILVFSAMISAMGLLLFAYSHSLTSLIFARLLMGLGSSSAATILILISKQYFDIKYLPILVGIAQFMGNLGSICGQYPLAIITNSYGWQTSILLLIVIPLIIIIGTYWFIDSNNINNRSTSFLEFFNKFKKVVYNKNNWIIACYATLVWTPFYTFASLWGITFLKKGINVSTLHASQLIAICWIASGIGSVLIGIWSSSINKTKICMSISAILGVISFPFLLFIHQNNILLITILFLFGTASAGQALSFAVLNDINDDDVIGTAVGFLNTIIMTGTMIIDPLIGWFLNFNLTDIQNNIINITFNAFNKAFIIIPLLFLLAFLLSLFYKDNKSSNGQIYI